MTTETTTPTPTAEFLDALFGRGELLWDAGTEPQQPARFPWFTRDAGLANRHQVWIDGDRLMVTRYDRVTAHAMGLDTSGYALRLECDIKRPANTRRLPRRAEPYSREIDAALAAWAAAGQPDTFTYDA